MEFFNTIEQEAEQSARQPIQNLKGFSCTQIHFRKITAKIISFQKNRIFFLRVWGQMGQPLVGLKSDYVWLEV